MRFVESPNKYRGRTEKIKSIVIHHWGDPQDYKGTKPIAIANYFAKKSSQVSAHYVVSNKTIIQCVSDLDTAWHARQANPFTIGIEVDPNPTQATYETVGKLVKQLRDKHGKLPLEKHSKYVNTNCPGSINLAKIDKIAKGQTMKNGHDANYWFKKNEWARKTLIPRLEKKLKNVENLLKQTSVDKSEVMKSLTDTQKELAKAKESLNESEDTKNLYQKALESIRAIINKVLGSK